MTTEPVTLEVEPGISVPAAQVAPGEVSGVASALKLPAVRGAVAVVGGAKEFDTPEFEAVRAQVARLLAELAELAAAQGLAVVDGGTPHGVMRLMGAARAGQGGGFPLIGVVPLGRVTWAGRAEGEGGGTALEPRHSAFVLVESDQWGGESSTLAALVHALAGERAALEVVINGGDVTLLDVGAFLEQGERGDVVAIAGSGRLADDVVAAAGGEARDAALRVFIETGRVRTFPLGSAQGAFTDTLGELMGVERL